MVRLSNLRQAAARAGLLDLSFINLREILRQISESPAFRARLARFLERIDPERLPPGMTRAQADEAVSDAARRAMTLLVEHYAKHMADIVGEINVRIFSLLVDADVDRTAALQAIDAQLHRITTMDQFAREALESADSDFARALRTELGDVLGEGPPPSGAARPTPPPPPARRPLPAEGEGAVKFRVPEVVEAPYLGEILDGSPQLRGLVQTLAAQDFPDDEARAAVVTMLRIVLDELGDAPLEVSMRGTRLAELGTAIRNIHESVLAGHGLPEGITPRHLAALLDEFERVRRSAADPEGALGRADPTRRVREDIGEAGEPPPGGQPFRGGSDVLLAKHWRDQTAPLSRSRLPNARARREWLRTNIIEPFVLQFMPAGTRFVMVSLDITQSAVRDALARLGADDLFLPHGFEVRFILPGGVTFQPDGIRFTSPGRYRLRENKEALTTRSRSFWDTPEGRESLRGTLLDDAAIANALKSRGCEGFEWTTGVDWLDRIIAEVKAEAIADGASGSELLHLIILAGRD